MTTCRANSPSAPAPLTMRARDPETGETFEAPTTREDVATGLADLRRSRDE